MEEAYRIFENFITGFDTLAALIGGVAIYQTFINKNVNWFKSKITHAIGIQQLQQRVMRTEFLNTFSKLDITQDEITRDRMIQSLLDDYKEYKRIGGNGYIDYEFKSRGLI